MNALLIRRREGKSRRYIVDAGWLRRRVSCLSEVSVRQSPIDNGLYVVTVTARDNGSDVEFLADFPNAEEAWRFVHQDALIGLALLWGQFWFTISMVGLLRHPPSFRDVAGEAKKRFPESTQEVERAFFKRGANEAMTDYYRLGDYTTPVYTDPNFNAGYIWSAAGGR